MIGQKKITLGKEFTSLVCKRLAFATRIVSRSLDLDYELRPNMLRKSQSAEVAYEASAWCVKVNRLSRTLSEEIGR